MHSYSCEHMPDYAFLTPRKREIVDGADADELEIDEATWYNHRAGAKNQARQALEELTMIAESQHIDHTDVFDPDDVFRFLRALLTADATHHYATDEVPTMVTDDVLDDDFLAYRDRLYVQMDKFLRFRQQQGQ